MADDEFDDDAPELDDEVELEESDGVEELEEDLDEDLLLGEADDFTELEEDDTEDGAAAVVDVPVVPLVTEVAETEDDEDGDDDEVIDLEDEDDTDVEDPLDVLLRERISSDLEDEEDEDDDEEVPGDGASKTPAKRRADERYCTTCFLVLPVGARLCPMGDPDCPVLNA
jgi:hypothetical protein